MAGWRGLGVAGAEAYESCVKERGERQELWLLLSVDFIMTSRCWWTIVLWTLSDSYVMEWTRGEVAAGILRTVSEAEMTRALGLNS